MRIEGGNGVEEERKTEREEEVNNSVPRCNCFTHIDEIRVLMVSY